MRFFGKNLPLYILPLLLVLCLVPPPARAAQGEETLRYQASDTGGQVYLQKVDGKNYLFLPASADLSALTLWFDGGDAVLSNGEGTALSGSVRQATIHSGTPFALASLFPSGTAEGQWALTFTQGSETFAFILMKSENIRSLFLTSGDPAQNRSWVEQKKSNKAKNVSLLMLGADGHVVYDGGLKTVKGRGNSSWEYGKKPYQIKLENKTDLLETGDPAEAETTWVLLANYCDPSLLHNTLTFALATELGLAYTPHCQPADLYYDGEYRGSYLLCEKTEVSKGRVAVHDLEDDMEDANPGVEDFDALPTAQGTTAGSGAYRYVTGLTLPEDATGGYLLEIDYPLRADEEKSWFRTRQGAYLVSKSPEYLSEEGIQYIQGVYQRFEDAVYNGGTDPAIGKDYSQLMDVRSLAACYFLLELSEDIDAFQSSTFFYKPQGDDKLYAGPLWDFDQGYGVSGADLAGDSLVAGRMYLAEALLAIPSFQEAVKEVSAELQPLLKVALSTDAFAKTGALKSLRGWGAELAASQRMNAVLWPDTAPRAYSQLIDALRTRLSSRNWWLSKTVNSWDGSRPSQLDYFADVPSFRWYAEPVMDMVKRGYFTGVSRISFDPNGVMTRAMVVTILYRVAGQPEVSSEQVFGDVWPNSWYGPAVAWAKSAGLAQGNLQGDFDPASPVSRQELMTFLYRMSGSPSHGADLTTFSDWQNVRPYAHPAVSWGVAVGLLQGGELNDLLPGWSATRAQCAVIVQRYLALN